MSKENKEHIITKFKNEKDINLLIPDVDNSSFEFLNKKKYENIKYDGLKSISESQYSIEGNYHIIKFNLLETSFIEPVINDFEEILKSKKENQKYDDILKDIINYFQTITNSISTEKIHGDIGEALFVLKCLELDLKIELTESLYTKNEGDKFDFTFKNNQIIEVKSTSKFLSEIKVNLSQSKINDDNVNIVVIKNDFYKSKINNNGDYLSIIDIYDMIEQKIGNLCPLFSENKQKYLNNDDLVQRNIINLKETQYYFFKKQYLPEIDIKKQGSLKSITYILDATTSIGKGEEFSQEIINIAKRENKLTEKTN